LKQDFVLNYYHFELELMKTLLLELDKELMIDLMNLLTSSFDEQATKINQ